MQSILEERNDTKLIVGIFLGVVLAASGLVFYLAGPGSVESGRVAGSSPGSSFSAAPPVLDADAVDDTPAALDPDGGAGERAERPTPVPERGADPRAQLPPAPEAPAPGMPVELPEGPTTNEPVAATWPEAAARPQDEEVAGRREAPRTPAEEPEALERAVEDDPASIDAWIALARARSERRADAAALGAADRAIALDPDHGGALFVRGQALYGLGRFEEAVPVLERSVDVDHENGYAHNLLGLAYLELGRPADAVRSLEMAVALEPGVSFIADNLEAARSRVAGTDLSSSADPHRAGAPLGG